MNETTIGLLFPKKIRLNLMVHDVKDYRIVKSHCIGSTKQQRHGMKRFSARKQPLIKLSDVEISCQYQELSSVFYLASVVFSINIRK